MSRIQSPFPVWKCPITEVTGIWLTNIPAFHTNITRVPADHNLQLVIKGSYQLKINDQPYWIAPGSVIYYYHSESVYWMQNDEPVSFYSFVFKGKDILPLPLHKRVVNADTELASEFKNVYTAALSSYDYLNQIIVYSGLLKILKVLNFQMHEQNLTTDLWQSVESRLLQNDEYRPTMDDIKKIGGFSRATLYRACMEKHGIPPARRFQELRLAKAQFLLHSTPMSVTQISQYLGYPRIHEFSREFTRVVNMTPSVYRNNFLNQSSARK